MTYRNQQLIPDVIVRERKGKRNLFQYRFWIDAAKPEELAMGERLEAVRAVRKFAPTIRNALRLFFELTDGQTDALRALFPGIVQRIQREAVEQIEPPANNQVMALMAQVIDIQAQLASRPTISPNGETPRLPAPDTLPSIFATDAHDDPGAARATFAGGLGNLFDDIDQDEDF